MCPGTEAVGGSNVTTGQLVDDCNTLLALRDTLRGTSEAYDNWSTALAISSWDGVTSGTNGVTQFDSHRDRYGRKADGTLPNTISKLTSIGKLRFHCSHLRGAMPSELGSLAGHYIELSCLTWTGHIPPELGNLSNASKLLLGHSHLTGPIPPELGNLITSSPRAPALTLQYNQLTGTIPPELGRLTGEHSGALSLESNWLSGPIPPELGKLGDPYHGAGDSGGTLALGGNQLSGSIPLELGNLNDGLRLRLADGFQGNLLSGCFPWRGYPLAQRGGVVLGSCDRLLVGADPPSVAENSSTTYSVGPATAPSADVTVKVSLSGDADLSFDTDENTSGAQDTLTFTPSDWDAQSVYVYAGNDADSADGSGVLSLAVSSADPDYDGYSVTADVLEVDDDLGLRASGVATTSAWLELKNSSTDWYYKQVSPSTGSCAPDSAIDSDGGMGRVTGLSPNTSYTFKAYSDSSCTSGNELTSDATDAEFTTGSGVVVSRAGFLTPTQGMSVDEGGTAWIWVRLASAPTGTVTVTAARASGDADVSVDTNLLASGSQSTLTFTTSNWSDPQAVMVTAAQDDDREPGTAMFSLTPSSSDAVYNSSEAMLRVSELDDDAVLSGYAVKPSEAILVIANHLGNWHWRQEAPTQGACSAEVQAGKVFARVSGLSPATSYRFKAYADSSCSAASELTASATSAEFTTGGLVVSRSAVAVAEGSSAAYTLRLAAPPVQPNTTVTVTISDTGSDSHNLTWDTDPSDSGDQNELEFTAENWSAPQTVTVRAGEDDSDTSAGSATLTHTVSEQNTEYWEREFGSGSLLYSIYDVWGPATDTYTAVTATVTVTEVEDDAVLAASGVSATRATLTIANHGGAWHWRQEQPTQGTCSSAVAAGTSSAALTGLSAGNSYTFKAYSDASCSTANELTTDDSDAEFSTSNLVLSASALTVGEASSATYTVKLAAAPTDDVTVTVSAATGSDSDSDLSFDTDDQTTGNQSMLTFTSTTWDTAQDVTVSAAADSDTAHGTAVLVHTAASNDSAYSGTTAELVASERDDDAALSASSVTATTATLTIANRTGAWHYRRSLPTAGTCTGPVTAGTSTAALSGLTAGTAYTFKAYSDASCSTANELTSDATDAEFTTSALAASSGALSVPEGSGAFYSVRLHAAPASDVVVTVQRSSGDDDITFDTDLDAAGDQTRLTFTPQNWDTAQFVWVAAAEDRDSVAGTAVLTHTASSADTGFNGLMAVLNVTESDNDASLAASSVTETGATLTIANHSGAWHYRQLSPTLGACSTAVAAGTSTATLSSLTAGTAYVFKAYSDTACQTALTVDIDDAAFATPGVMLSRARLIVPEGSTATYTARLATKPSADVTVTVAAASGGDSDLTFDTDGDTTGSQSTLTFTTQNWSTPQTVTVAAAEETGSPVDKAYGAATLNHTASGYTTATTALAVSEGDNDVCPGTAAVGGANVTSGTIVDDCNTLLALKAALAGTSTALANWATTLALNSWTGVTADTSGATALSVRSPASKLDGMLPNTLGSLARLTGLSLDRNQLTGAIPAELGSLSSLTGLWLYDNRLSGAIPTQLGSLSSLTGLGLYRNQLTGTIPTQLGDLSSLAYLGFHGNRLTGAIPTELGSLSSLTRLSLGDNQLTGTIPTQLGSLSSLVGLWLYGNQLSGAIPSELGSLSSLQWLQLHDNRLSGSLPSELGSLSSLTRLWLENNRLTGAIPSELGSLSSLTSLDLHANRLTGTIPDELGNLDAVRYMDLEDNRLTGTIPDELGDLDSISTLDLSGNRLTGAIPDDLGDLSSTLDRLLLRDNRLSGQIPAELAGLWNLDVLDLGGNLLSGDIPDELGRMNLDWLGLCCNRLSGPIPAELGDLAYLSALDLSHNRLSGQIPAELGRLSELTRLWLGDNQLTGTIPAVLGDLVGLEPADPADNSQTGDLWLAQNRLSGCVPAGLLAHLGDINPQNDSTNLKMCAGLVISPVAVNAQEGSGASRASRTAAAPAAEVVIGGGVTVGPQADALSPGRAAAAARRAPAPRQGGSGDQGGPDANAHEQQDAGPSGQHGAQQQSVGAPGAASRTGEPQSGAQAAQAGPSGATASSGATLASSVDVGEGGTASYTVRLATQPAASVTVAISAATGSDSDITFNPSTLTFTASNWNRTQTVTVSAAQDNDGASGTAVLSHAATSTDPAYSGLTSAATVRETDDETALNATSVFPTSAYLLLSNASSAWYYKQTSPTTGTCSTGSITAGSGTWLVSLKPNTSYTYKAYSDSACSSANELTSDDTDAEFTTGSGVYTTPSTRVTVDEGSTATYHVRLVSQPSADVTVTIAAASGSDGSLTFDTDIDTGGNQSMLTLTSSNWQNGLPVVVSAAHDDDTANGTATFTHTPASTDASYSGGVVTIVAAERDDDAQLAGYAATTSGATLLISNHEAAWHYRRSSPAQSACSPQVPAGIASATVTGLAGATTHTFKAYADPRCTIELTTDATDAEFTTATATLAASSLTSTGATLTISNHTGAWRHKRTAPTAGDCSDEIAAGTSSATVTGLTPGVSYTFKAHSDASCTAEITTNATDAEFTTVGGVLSASSVTAAEGATATYTLALAAAPSSNVTVTVAATGDGDLTVSPGTLTFTDQNWGTAQTLTVTAAQDPDGTHGTATITHTAASSDSAYSGLALGTVTATETDDDATLAASGVSSTGATLTISNHSGAWRYKRTAPTTGTCSNGIAIGTSQAALAGLDAATAYTFKAYSDASCATELTTDATDAEFTTVGGVLSASSVTAAEGATATYTLALAAAPSSDVTVTVAATGDGDLTVSPGTLTFTDQNWGTAQTLTVTAAQDADGTHGTATITHTAASSDSAYSGLALGTVTATETDDDATLAVSGVTSTGATLRVSNHTGAWRYRRAAPTAGSCSAQVGSGTPAVALSGLAPGVSYVFKAYSDASCATELTTDATDAEFATPGVALSVSSLTVAEGTSETYTVRLSTAPAGDVTVTVTRSGDGDLSVDTDAGQAGSQSTLTFTAANWHKPQTVTVTAAQELGSDTSNGTATLRHQASSAYTTAVTALAVSEADDDVCPASTAVGGASVTSGGLVDDCLALLGAKTALAGTSSALANWGSNLAMASWTGITVSGGRVTALSLPSRSLDGTLPTALGGLSALTSLDVSSNSLTGPIPAQLGDLTTLTALKLHANSLSGCVPANLTGFVAANAINPQAGGVNLEVCKGIVLSDAHPTVDEGATATYTVRLATQPAADVTVALGVTAGPAASTAATATAGPAAANAGAVAQTVDPSITVSPSSLTFTDQNWSTDQTVTVTAAQDDDGADSTVVITHTATSSGDTDYHGLAAANRVAEADDELALTATWVARNAATLTITNHTGAWHHKQTAPTEGDCSAQIASGTTSANLTGLSASTAYTYKAYSDASCSTELTNNDTDAEFTTPAAPPPTTNPGGNNPGGGTPGGGAPTGGGGGGGSGAARPERLSGADRYATAKAVADKLVELLETADPATGVRQQVDTVIIASGQAFPDALTAAALSKVLRAPVLLTSKNRLEAPVRAFIARHRPATAVMVGGPAAVSADVEADILAMDEISSVVRHAGRDRYDTAAKVAAAVGAPQRLCGTTKPTVIVTTGRNYPDALVAGPLAYRGRHPILLTDPHALPQPTRDWLTGSGAKHAVVIGGAKAVSTDVLDELKALGLSAERLSGTDRADTSAKVARKLTSLVCATDRFRKDAIGLATGWAFPDALAAAPLLGHYGAPLLLTSPAGVPQALIDYAKDGLLEPDFDLPPITTIGGRTAVPTTHQTKLLANLPR